MNWKIPTFTGVIGIVLGFVAGYVLYRPSVKPTESYQPQIVQGDSSVVLERKPDPKAKPSQLIPKGATVERIVQVEVQPNVEPHMYVPNTPGELPGFIVLGAGPSKVENQSQRLSLPTSPVRVDLSLIRLEDGSRRVVASSPDGIVTGGVDIPVEKQIEPKQLNWSAGGMYNPNQKTFGAWVQRNAGPFVFGIMAFKYRDQMHQSTEAMLQVGVRF